MVFVKERQIQRCNKSGLMFGCFILSFKSSKEVPVEAKCEKFRWNVVQILGKMGSRMETCVVMFLYFSKYLRSIIRKLIFFSFIFKTKFKKN